LRWSRSFEWAEVQRAHLVEIERHRPTGDLDGHDGRTGALELALDTPSVLQLDDIGDGRCRDGDNDDQCPGDR